MHFPFNFEKTVKQIHDLKIQFAFGSRVNSFKPDLPSPPLLFQS